MPSIASTSQLPLNNLEAPVIAERDQGHPEPSSGDNSFTRGRTFLSTFATLFSCILGESSPFMSPSRHLSSPSSRYLAPPPVPHAQDTPGKGETAVEEGALPRIVPAPDVASAGQSGWEAVAKSIREVDVHKVKDVQDDLDNILVFAGLYSAVLSALIAISLLSLQPDTTSMMIVLLTQIVTQTHSYTITPGFLNSTVPPLDVAAVVGSSFEPTPSAKRVNVLWFASLTLSLISASFGILVKQWLREYLAGEYVSSQARLRVRHFRAPGLERWHVFGIASFLPLILQLALALFFIGLCFFTLNIHPSIGYTTIPLVAGWALLFTAAAFAPALSPQCPYKVPLLTRGLRSLFWHLSQLIGEPQGAPTESEKMASSASAGLSLNPGAAEEKAVTDASLDDDILCKLDKSQVDDELLRKMCIAAKETFPSSESKLNFVVRILEYRLGTQLPTSTKSLRFPMLLDLTALPSRTLTILMDAIADVLRPELQRFQSNQAIKWEDWSWNGMMLLLSYPSCMLSEKASDTIALCFSVPIQAIRNDLFQGMFEHPTARIMHGLNTQVLGLLARLQPVCNHLSAIHAYNLLETLLVSSPLCVCGPRCGLQECLDKHAESIRDVVVEQMCDILVSRMRHDMEQAVPWNSEHDKIIVLLCAYRCKLPENSLVWRNSFQELVHTILCRKDLMAHFNKYQYARNGTDVNFMTVYQKTCLNSSDIEPFLNNLDIAFKDYVAEIRKIPHLLDADFCIGVLRFLSGQISLLNQAIKPFPVLYLSRLLPSVLNSIMKTTHAALQETRRVKPEREIPSLVRKILQDINQLDDAWDFRVGQGRRVYPDPEKDFEAWAKEFDVRYEFVSDDLIADLVWFLPSAEGKEFRRARRIGLLQQDRKDMLPKLRYADDDATPGGAGPSQFTIYHEGEAQATSSARSTRDNIAESASTMQGE